ncbi:MAG TPA: hypothetical protein DEZ08_06630 [Dehalococcoidia bacterium]|nr:hypothetical protein [Dehalococcoidia bacterium]|tara:strand:- start:331 stop:525 length:195 start_codon:yes stop_codon:yes gene_type:complete
MKDKDQMRTDRFSNVLSENDIVATEEYLKKLYSQVDATLDLLNDLDDLDVTALEPATIYKLEKK